MSLHFVHTAWALRAYCVRTFGKTPPDRKPFKIVSAQQGYEATQTGKKCWYFKMCSEVLDPCQTSSCTFLWLISMPFLAMCSTHMSVLSCMNELAVHGHCVMTVLQPPSTQILIRWMPSIELNDFLPMKPSSWGSGSRQHRKICTAWALREQHSVDAPHKMSVGPSKSQFKGCSYIPGTPQELLVQRMMQPQFR